MRLNNFKRNCIYRKLSSQLLLIKLQTGTKIAPLFNLLLLLLLLLLTNTRSSSSSSSSISFCFPSLFFSFCFALGRLIAFRRRRSSLARRSVARRDGPARYWQTAAVALDRYNNQQMNAQPTNGMLVFSYRFADLLM